MDEEIKPDGHTRDLAYGMEKSQITFEPEFWEKLRVFVRKEVRDALADHAFNTR